MGGQRPLHCKILYRKGKPKSLRQCSERVGDVGIGFIDVGVVI